MDDHIQYRTLIGFGKPDELKQKLLIKRAEVMIKHGSDLDLLIKRYKETLTKGLLTKKPELH